MDYKVFYRKYRPQDFNSLVGQNHIKNLLLNSIINNKLSHAYLFTGPRGTGKTSTAKLFAKIINCETSKDGISCNKCPACMNYNESPDIIEIDAASNNGVDEIRELRDNIKILPSFSKFKIYIIDEVHMLSSSAWNAFLKTLEEPPHHVIFILATTEIQKVPVTVLSRCQRFDFQKITDDVIAEQLAKIAKSEKIKISSEAITEVARLADGSLRDALSILDQLSKLDIKIEVDTLIQSYGILTINNIESLIMSLNNGEVLKFTEKLDDLQNMGIESTVLLSKLLDYLVQEAISAKSMNKIKYSNILNLEDLILDLVSCYGKANQYILIKVVLLKHCNVKSTQVEELKEDIKIKPESLPIISREIIAEREIPKFNQDLINIRINNAYVNANIDLKKEFTGYWQEFINLLIKSNELKFLSLVKDLKVEVVSPTNVIFSTEFYSNSVLFNAKAEEIENRLKKEYKIDRKLVCLDLELWLREKSEYIKTKKSKKYELINEPTIAIQSETLNSAEELFGNELIEIN